MTENNTTTGYNALAELNADVESFQKTTQQVLHGMGLQALRQLRREDPATAKAVQDFNGSSYKQTALWLVRPFIGAKTPLAVLAEGDTAGLRQEMGIRKALFSMSL